MLLYENLRKLLDYTPAERGYTSEEEMQMIIDTLKLKECSNDDLCNYRDMTVAMWTGFKAPLSRLDPEWDKLSEAEYSIVAVIDEVKASRGMEV